MMLEWAETFELPVGDTVYSFQMISKMDDSSKQYSYPVHFVNDSISIRVPFLKINEISADFIDINYICYSYHKDQSIGQKEIASMKHIQIERKKMSGFYTATKAGNTLFLIGITALTLLASYAEVALIVTLF